MINLQSRKEQELLDMQSKLELARKTIRAEIRSSDKDQIAGNTESEDEGYQIAEENQ